MIGRLVANGHAYVGANGDVFRALRRERRPFDDRGKGPLRRHPDAGLKRWQELLGARREGAAAGESVKAVGTRVASSLVAAGILLSRIAGLVRERVFAHTWQLVGRDFPRTLRKSWRAFGLSRVVIV